MLHHHLGRRSPQRLLSGRALMCLILASALAGCGDPPRIRHYQIRRTKSTAESPLPSTASGTVGSSLTFETPEGWQPGPLTIERGGITVRREAALEVRNDSQRAEITVTRLPAGAPLLDNVNRWRRQIQLPPWTEDDLNREVRTLMVNQQPAHYVQLEGEEQAILGVLVDQGSQTWFIKLQGDLPLARQERDRFEQFVQSLQFTE